MRGLGYATTDHGSGHISTRIEFGVVLVQVPGAWLADSFGRLRVIVMCHLVMLAGLALLFWLTKPPRADVSRPKQPTRGRTGTRDDDGIPPLAA